MKKLMYLFACISLMTLMYGCPYDSEYPVDEPGVTVDHRLIGTWNNKGKPEDVLRIARKDEKSCYIILTLFDKGKTDTLVAFPSLVGGTTFLNIKHIHPEKDHDYFMLAKIRFNGDKELEADILSDEIKQKFKDSKDVKGFIAANVNNAKIYEKDKLILVKRSK